MGARNGIRVKEQLSEKKLARVFLLNYMQGWLYTNNVKYINNRGSLVKDDKGVTLESDKKGSLATQWNVR